jgi:hypothetical protein
MQNTKLLMTAASLAACVLACSPAYASCSANSIVGTWQDTYGTVATITSASKGTAIAAGIICNLPGTVYKLAITQSGSPPTTARISGHAPKASGCPALHATLTYQANSCTTASGPLDFNKLELQDIWLKQTPKAIKKRSFNPAMTQGMR